ncbi:MAG: conjugal transfer protein TraF [Hydrogenovibrio crunogenus]|nr:conjugal transfer protein TraF [Hydrogenovibrio crunogenus]
MNRLKLISALCLLGATSAQAAPSSSGPIGPNIGYGDASNANTIYDPLANPANNALNAADTEGYRVGLGINAQTRIEIENLEGASDYYDTKIDPLLNDITNAPQLETNLEAFIATYDKGNISTISGVTVPLVIKTDSMAGGLSLDYTRQVGAAGVIIKGTGNVTPAADGTNLTINRGSAALGVTYKQLDEFALGYGFKALTSGNSALTIGVTARYLTLLSNQNNVDLKQFIDDNVSGSTNFSDYVDGMDTGSTDSNLTADIGINWMADNYMIGLTGMNLTEPTFKVNNMSSTQNKYDYFSYLVPAEYKMKAQYRVSAQVYSENREWTLAGSYDLAESNDLNNNDTQWWSVGASYATNSAWYIPDVRFGLRGNLIGTEKTYTNVGLTLGFLNLDVATTTMDFSGVEDKQKDAGIMASLGVEFDF